MSDWLNKLVLARSEPRLFGKVVADVGDTVKIEFFRSVADREILPFAKHAVIHLQLPAQTRVFSEIPDIGWRVGRAVEAYKSAPGTYTYLVKFPNDVAIELSEEDCFVRCLDRYADPARILAAHCIETQFFADRRRLALAALRRLRTAAQGLTGIVSAPIELVPHQLATVRRVVTDRHQRYLLADEVGLGKTIEAGLIIRQLLLDHPLLRVQVWVPAVLESQWRNELESRCLLSANAVALRSHEDLNAIDWADIPDLLVIDEAHRLIIADVAGQASTFHQRVRETAARTPRLLLLSATPALGEEAQLLALLTLLDPGSYAQVPLEEFRRRVADRQLIGRLLLPMRPGASAFVLRQQATRALDMFPADPIVKIEASRVLGDAQEERDAAIAALRDHIANTYRIHQRIIRARRVDVEDLTMMPRGPEWPVMTHVRFFFGTDGCANDLLMALDGWRNEANRASADDDDLAATLAERWGQLIEAAWRGAGCLVNAVEALEPLFVGEDQDLAELERVGLAWTTGEDRYAVAAATINSWLRDLAPGGLGHLRKLVCFSTDSADAQRLADHLQRTIGVGKVTSLAKVKEEEVGTVVSAFAASQSAQVLVCDRSAEEGLNLQFVYGMVHMDLPFDPARLEQRIGRLDRFGRRAARVEHRVFMPDDRDDTPWRAWFGVLANGFRTFNRSMSDVQFQINPLQRDAVLHLFRSGAYELETLEGALAAKLQSEREKLDEQHALDDLAQLIDVGEDIRRSIDESEEDEAGLRNAVEPWVRDVLGLSVETVGGNSSATLRFGWPSGTLLPTIPWKREFESPLRQRWTWSRKQSMRSARPPAYLLRPGSELTEVLERVALWDDRGIAYATWRVEPRWDGQSRAFRLVWLVEPALEVDTPVYAPRRGSEIARRAEAFLPPFSVEQYVDERGRPIDSPELLELLARPYNSQRSPQGKFDLNLGSRPDALHEAIDWGNFVARSEEVTLRGRQILDQTPEVAARLAQARRACETDLNKARRHLEVRRTLAAKFPDRVECPLPEEEADLETLRRAVQFPNVRLDEIGFFVISPTAPGS